MAEYKYTSDGKKVAIVGQLNSQETIVQEVFVTEGGQEVPSGENFVVKSLHESRVVPWQEKEIEAAKRALAKIESEKKRANDDLRLARAKAKAHAKALREFVGAAPEQLAQLEAFVSGEITHVFIDAWEPRLIAFDEVIAEEDFRWDGEIKLLSLFGRSGGDFAWKLNQYGDGSGSWTEVFPASSREEAFAIAQRRCDEVAEAYVSGERGYFYLDTWDALEGVVVPAAAREKFNREKREGLERDIAKSEANIAKKRKEMETLSS